MGEIILFSILGFFASIIDGCIGMAYGTILASIFALNGVPLLVSSASIHFSEIFTTFASGLSHLSFKNVDFKLLKKIVLPGALGAVVGALMLSFASDQILRPIVSSYLIALGIYILLKQHIKKKTKSFKRFRFLGLIGGFCDAAAGGGWGPIVTGTLISRGHIPHKTIGTVNLTEFFVTLSQSAIFFSAIGLTSVNIVIGLILGSVIAAPFAAYIVKKINPMVLIKLVGYIIIITNIINLTMFFCGL